MNVFRTAFLLILAPLLLLRGQTIPPDIGKAESCLNIRHLLKEFSKDQHAAVRSAQRQFDVTAYRLSIELIPDQQLISGSVVTEAFSRSDGLQTIVLDLYDNMQVDSIISAGARLFFRRNQNTLEIDMPSPLARGDAIHLAVFYHGNPVSAGFGAFTWSEANGQPRVWTLSEPYGAPAWWPCKDDPADKADSVFLDITAPADLVIASNGILTSEILVDQNRRLTRWETRYPISPYLVVLTAADYHRFSQTYTTRDGDTMPIDYYVYPELLSQAQSLFPVTQPMLEYFSARFGEYPFVREKYGMAVVANGASMEHQTLTTLSARHLTDPSRAVSVIAHELAHHWFGDYITLSKWPDIWLHEGFASYCEALWAEHAGGDTAYAEMMDFQDPGSFEGPIIIADTTDLRVLFSSTVYRKGSWVLHMLRGILGEETFFEVLRQFIASPALAYGNATTGDFIAVCERVSGKSLDWFFEQWLYRPGRPVYDFKWVTSGSAAPYQTTVFINQRPSQPFQNSAPYKMPLTVRLSGSAIKDVAVWDSLPAQAFTIMTDFEPDKVMLDPDNWVLKRVFEIGLKEDLIPEKLELAQNYPNPFNGSTTIRYGIHRRLPVRVQIFNALGQAVFHHNLPLQPVGYHIFSWDGKDDDGFLLPSGIYFYRFSADNIAAVGKLILLQ